MSQTLAIFVDAYRDLNSRKLFWTTLILSLLIMVLFGMLSATPDSLKFLMFKVPFPAPQLLYKAIFLGIIIDIWMTWAAIILALISTAGIFPDFLNAGSIDLFLSKPISRVRLFLTKYFAGLIFVTLQVSLLCVTGYFVVGLRGHLWLSGIFLAIPIVILFFSYLYCVCVLVGMLTRSTIAAILLTALFWSIVFAINFTDMRMLESQLEQSHFMAFHEDAMRLMDKQLEKPDLDPAQRIGFETSRARSRRGYDEAKDWVDWVRKWHHGIKIIKTPLPRTSETVALLSRVMLTESEIHRLFNPNTEGQRPKSEARRAEAEARDELLSLERRKPIWSILGPSLGFEAVLIALSAWIFSRRDY